MNKQKNCQPYLGLDTFKNLLKEGLTRGTLINKFNKPGVCRVKFDILL